MESILWNAWRNAEIRIAQLEEITKNLSQRKNSQLTTFETDEEEFMSPTEIEEFPGRKRNLKRKAVKSSVRTSPPKFELKTTSKEKALDEPRETLPPPIFVNDVEDFNAFKAAITNNDEKTIKIKVLGNNSIKVNTENSEEYREMIKLLKKLMSEEATKNLNYHTYQCKNEKPFKIVVRGLHPSTGEAEITRELECLGHSVIRATNIIGRKKIDGVLTKIPLPLFYVDLKTKDNNKEVFELTHLLFCKIKVEQPRLKKELPQCKRCQCFGHTQNYCHRQEKCVKCGQDHSTKQCDKSRDAPCKCANCGGDHTANWKGCPIYREKIASITKTKSTVT